MGVIIPGDFKVVHTKRYFALNVFVLTRFHCTVKPVLVDTYSIADRALCIKCFYPLFFVSY